MANLILGTEKVLGQETTVSLKEEKDILLIAPTRSGYESKIFIPNLFLNKTNIIMFDYKGWHYLVTKNKREELGYKTINVNFYEEVDVDDILNKLDDKFTLYINLHKPYLCNDISKREDATKDKIENSKKMLSKVKELIEKIFAKIKEKNIDCLSFIEYPELLTQWNINLKQFQCKNNKMILQVQFEDFLSKVQERCRTPIEFQIKENELNVVKLVENNILLDKLIYKDKELDFIKIKLNKEDVVEDEFWETSNKTAKICDIREENYQVKIKEK
jgi:hypothetical protein